MANRRKRLERQKARQADQALVDRLATDLVAQGLPSGRQLGGVPSVHHPLYFCVRSYYDGSDKRWNFSTKLDWLKHTLHSNEWAKSFFVDGVVSPDMGGLAGSYVKFPEVWQGTANGPLTMEEACNIASVEDDTPKRHDLQWMCDLDQTQYLDQICIPEALASAKVTRGESPYGKLYQTTPATEQSEDLLDILFGDGGGAKLSEIADMRLTPISGGPAGDIGDDI